MKLNDEHLQSQRAHFDFALLPLPDKWPCRLKQKKKTQNCTEHTHKKLNVKLLLLLIQREKKIHLKPWSHISVTKVSPGYTCKRNRLNIFLTMFGSPLQINLMIALTANPIVHSPCNIGREKLQHRMQHHQKCQV